MVNHSALVIRGARVFDGQEVLGAASVVVEGGMIASVAADLATPRDSEVIDGRGMTLLPGLIDAHTHVFPKALEQALAFGVTTELDMFADPEVVASLKAAACERDDVADLRSAGWGATVPNGHPCYLVEMGYYRRFPTLTDPHEAEAFVAARLAEGSDYLKLILEDGTTTGWALPTLGAETARALVRAAHQRERPAIAHATTASAARQAVEAGADGLAHLFVDRPGDPDLVQALADTGAFVIPTLAVLAAICGSSAGAELAADEQFSPYLDPTSRGTLAMPFPAGPEARRDLGVAIEALAELKAAGVALLAGSDASNPGTAHGASLHRELALLVDAGLTPVEALAAATAVPADVFGLTDRGRVAPGRRADLLLVEGDATTDIAASADIVAVWRRGRRLDREAYREAVEAEAGDAWDA